MSGFGDCSFFQVDMSSRPDIGENSPFFLKDVLVNCCKSHSLSLGMFCSVGRKGSFWDVLVA